LREAVRFALALAVGGCVQPELDRSAGGIGECYDDAACVEWGDCCSYDTSSDSYGTGEGDGYVSYEPEPEPWSEAGGVGECRNQDVRFGQFYCAELCRSIPGCSSSDGIHECRDDGSRYIASTCAWRGQAPEPRVEYERYYVDWYPNPVSCTEDVRRQLIAKCEGLPEYDCTSAGLRFCHQLTGGPTTGEAECNYLSHGEYRGRGWWVSVGRNASDH